MPSLGADMEEGTLVEWLVQPGDAVSRGDLVAAVDTNKARIEVECFEAGVVDRLLVEPGQTVPVGTPLAHLSTGAPLAPPATASREAAAGSTSRRKAPPASPPVRKLAAQVGVDLATVHGTGHGGAVTRADVEESARGRAATPPEAPAAGGGPPAPRSRISPHARRLAAELGVDLVGLEGSAADGSVRARDVRAAAGRTEEAAPPPVAAGPDRETVRQAIASLMARSKREIPHYYLHSTIDLGAALDWMRERNRHASVADRLVSATLLLKACARAATEVPALNGHWIDDHFVPSEAVHLGVVVSLHGGGVLTPTIPDAARLPLTELMHRLRDVVSRARTGRLRSSDTAEATITVTNLGELGVEGVQGVIYPPQVALAGFGSVVRRVWAVGDLIGIRPVVTATLSGDHRATDGATGARFLTAVDASLQRPEEL